MNLFTATRAQKKKKKNMYTESYFNSVSSLMDEKFEAQRDKIKLSTETELLIRDRGKKEPRTPDILHSSINLLE